MTKLQLISSFQSSKQQPISALSFSTSGRNLVAGTEKGEISVWSVRRWEESSGFRAEGLAIEQIVFVNDWTFYAFGPNTALRYQTLELKIENVNQETPRGSVQSISSDEKWIAAAHSVEGFYGVPVTADEPFLILGKWKSGEEVCTFKAQHVGRELYHLHPYALHFSPDNRFLAICVELSDIEWEYRLFLLQLDQQLDDEEVLRSQFEASYRIGPLCFSSNSSLLAFGYLEDCSIQVMETNEASRETNSFYGHREPITALAFHSNGYYLASGSEDGTLRIWDIKQDSMISIYQHSTKITSLAFHPSDNILTFGDEQGHICVIDVSTA